MNRHRAFSLVELLVAMSATTVLLAVSVDMVHRAMRVHSTTRERGQFQAEALRLSRQLRADAWLAVSAKSIAGELSMQLRDHAGEVKVVYAHEPARGIVRRESTNSLGSVRTEQYSLPGTVFTTSVRDGDGIVELVIESVNDVMRRHRRNVLQVTTRVGGRVTRTPGA